LLIGQGALSVGAEDIARQLNADGLLIGQPKLVGIRGLALFVLDTRSVFAKIL
jgi:hypothetical protein